MVTFLQYSVFSNLFVISANKSFKSDVKIIILNLLQDERIEVREATAETLSGFFHCEFIKIDNELIDTFKNQASIKLKNKEIEDKLVAKNYQPQNLLIKHSGILGLCSCVNAFPYDVPNFIPDILMILGQHLNDPQPIHVSYCFI